jgi:hypothetical protein
MSDKSITWIDAQNTKYDVKVMAFNLYLIEIAVPTRHLILSVKGYWCVLVFMEV